MNSTSGRPLIRWLCPVRRSIRRTAQVAGLRTAAGIFVAVFAIRDGKAAWEKASALIFWLRYGPAGCVLFITIITTDLVA